ncbi:MAG: DeoR/GlpR family DNA-binding transcription regulator [Mycobacterium sp.]
MAETDSSEEFRYVSAPQRRARMRAMILDEGFCTTAELAVYFDVSEMTVRRDVSKLASSDASLRIVHGGISAVPAAQSLGIDHRARNARNPTLKEAIAARAAEFVVADATIALDSGTTTLRMVESLTRHSSVHVVSQSLPVMAALINHDNVELTGLGGNLVRTSLSFEGPTTIESIRNLRIDTYFLAATSIDARGVFCGNDYDAATKRTLVDVADEVVLVTDSTKFTISSRIRVCALDRISRLVTDERISDEHRRMVEDAGIDVVTVPVHDSEPEPTGHS